MKQCWSAVFPCFGHAQWCGLCWGSCGFYSVTLRSTHSHVRFCRSTVFSDFAPFPCFGHAQWCGVCWGSCGFYSVALRSTHSHVRFCRLTVFSDFAPCPPSLSGKYEVSIMVPLFLQCDGSWWLPLTGLSWLPYNSALVHRVVMVTLRARLLCSPIFPGTFPKLIYCWWV